MLEHQGRATGGKYTELYDRKKMVYDRYESNREFYRDMLEDGLKIRWPEVGFGIFDVIGVLISISYQSMLLTYYIMY